MSLFFANIFTWWKRLEYTKHLCWIAGGRDTEYVIIEHLFIRGKEVRRRIIHDIPEEIIINEGKELEAGLLSSIDICTQGRAIVTGKQYLQRISDLWKIG